MSPPRCLLITVTEATDAARRHLAALLTSLSAQGRGGDVVVVVRGGGAVPPVPAGYTLHQVSAARRLGLSQARNIGLAYAARRGLLPVAELVAFPDDDCRYPSGLLARVHAHLAAGQDFVCGPYGPGALGVDHRRFPRTIGPVTPGLIMRAGCSSTVFMTAALARTVGRFDERFGLGGLYGSSEDSDYLLRALGAGFQGLYDPAMLVEHPYNPGRPAQYYRGNVAVLAKHGRRGGTRLLLLRRLASGMMLTIRGLLPAPALADVARSAARLLAEG